MTKVSIVIPVYNASKYLRATLDSVYNQTYTQWEALLIDDGSKDESGRICDEYTAKDSRFRTIHKKNEGVSAARNLGVSMAVGEFLCFLDSDDKMKPKHLEIGLSKIGDADLLIFGFERWNNRTDSMQMTDNYIEGAENCRDYLYSLKEESSTSEFFCFPWNKLYRRSLIVDNGVTFPTDISMREDEIFAYRYLPFVTSLKSISELLIEYNDALQGLSAKKMSSIKGITLAHYLIEQTKANNSIKTKTILYVRAMTYYIDALINSDGFLAKYKVAHIMLDCEKERNFTLDSTQIKGRYFSTLSAVIEKKSIMGIFILALIRKLYHLFRIYILEDAYLKRCGTNV